MPLSDGVAPAAVKPCGDDVRHGCAHAHAGKESALPFDANALISARGLGLRRNGRDLLIDVDLDISEREIVTLIGPNGAGKTTLVRAMLGLEKLDRGEVRRRGDLRIGYVPQRFDVDAVIPMTVERFLTLGGSVNARRVGDILAAVDASAVRHQQLGQLSGGEMQRVVLARALCASQPAGAREPVQGVDYSGEAEPTFDRPAARRERLRRAARVARSALRLARSDRVVCLNHHIAARACRRRSPSTRVTAVRRRSGARSPSTAIITITATTSPACRIRPRTTRRPPSPRAKEAKVIEPFFLRALVASLGLAAVAAPLGCFVVWQRMAYFGETVAQAGLIGVALGLALQMDVTWGVLIVALGVAGLCCGSAVRSRRARFHPRSASPCGVGRRRHRHLGDQGQPVDLMGFLFGDVFAVTGSDVAIIFVGGAAVLGVVAWLWQPLLRLAVHEELAAAEGVDRETVRTIFIILLAVTIAVAMKIVGILLVMAFLVVPAVAARPLTRTPERMVILTALIAAASVLGGLWLSASVDAPGGPSIVIIMSIRAGLSLSWAALGWPVGRGPLAKRRALD
jgi:zinc transport system permease protein